MSKFEAWQEFGRSVGLVEEVLTPNGDGGISITVGEWRDAFYAGWDAKPENNQDSTTTTRG